MIQSEIQTDSEARGVQLHDAISSLEQEVARLKVMHERGTLSAPWRQALPALLSAKRERFAALVACKPPTPEDIGQHKSELQSIESLINRLQLEIEVNNYPSAFDEELQSMLAVLRTRHADLVAGKPPQSFADDETEWDDEDDYDWQRSDSSGDAGWGEGNDHEWDA